MQWIEIASTLVCGGLGQESPTRTDDVRYSVVLCAFARLWTKSMSSERLAFTSATIPATLHMALGPVVWNSSAVSDVASNAGVTASEYCWVRTYGLERGRMRCPACAQTANLKWPVEFSFNDELGRCCANR